ncbi:MAG: hypothetical protein HY675_19610 [Chloroflexi bacterium]|nr:hypothetical protein [Chloroflexota bacterium]
MYRYVDAVFSHKLLILLPLIVIVPLSVLGSIFLSKTYEVSATIWIDSSPLLSFADGARNYKQANEVEADAINEWLGTKSFVRELIQKTGIQEEIDLGTWPRASRLEEETGRMPVVGSIVGLFSARRSNEPAIIFDLAVDRVRKSLKAEPTGAHTLKVAYAGDDPELGTKLVASTIELYNERSTARKTELAKVAIDFYQGQLRQHERSVEASATALRRFKETHPLALSGVRPPAEEQDLAQIERQYSLDRMVYDTVLDRLEQARLSAAADIQKSQSTFRIADSPEAPSASKMDRKKIILYTVVGLFVGLIVGLGTVIATTWASATVVSGDDLRNTGSVPVLATIPRLDARETQAFRETGKEYPVQTLLADLVSGNFEVA